MPEAELDRAVGTSAGGKVPAGTVRESLRGPRIRAEDHQQSGAPGAGAEDCEKALVLLKNDRQPSPPRLEQAENHRGHRSRMRRTCTSAATAATRGPETRSAFSRASASACGSAAKVVYAEGCKITLGKQGWAAWYENEVKLADPASPAGEHSGGGDVAKKANVAIVVVGENESTNREAWSEQHLGDRDSLDLLGAQERLVEAVVADRHTDGGAADQRTSALDQLDQAACAGDPRRLVPGRAGRDGCRQRDLR